MSTHIDPFAPADSPQHPANWSLPQGSPTPPVTPPPARVEAMPRWIMLPDEPVWSDDDNASVIGDERWTEYENLLELHGTDEERAYMAEVTANWPDDMPTLLDLRHRADESTNDDDDEKNDETDAEAELAAALAQLEGK